MRMLTKDPASPAVVIATLAFGIGANTTVFTLVNAVLFKGLPFEQADRIVSLLCEQQFSPRTETGSACPIPDLADLGAHTKTLQGLGWPSTSATPW